MNKSLDFSQLTYNDQIDPIYGFTNQLGIPNITQEQLPASNKINMFDMGAGGVVYSKYIYGGISFQHINRPKETFYETDSTQSFRLPMKLNFHAGGIIKFSKLKRWEDYFISPNLLFTTQGEFRQLNVGVYGNMKYVYVGAFFRHNFGNPDAVIGVVGLKINYVRIGYSYDYTISKLDNSGGAHELSLSVNLGSDHGPMDPSRKARRLECPRTFNF
jgi:type IX secretion system PorP/SprF family membrane protein